MTDYATGYRDGYQAALAEMKAALTERYELTDKGREMVKEAGK